MTPSTNYLFAQNECRQALQTAKCWGCKNTKKHLATPGFRKGIPGPASLKNVEGKARRRRQYASTARSRNAAIGIFSGSRLWPAFTFLRF